MVQQSLEAGRRLVEGGVEAERSGVLPSEEELCLLVKEGHQLGLVGGLVTDSLVRGARHYWNITTLTPCQLQL